MPINLSDLPNIDPVLFAVPEVGSSAVSARLNHRPRILLLYGSLRECSFSRLFTFEAVRLLEAIGAETRIFDPAGLPLPDGSPDSHPKAQLNCPSA